jgi:hypothetical protein
MKMVSALSRPEETGNLWTSSSLLPLLWGEDIMIVFRDVIQSRDVGF